MTSSLSDKFRIVVYTDSGLFSGHEMTLFDGLLGLLESEYFEITIIVCEGNHRFIEKLSTLEPNITVITTPYQTEAGDVFRVMLRTPKVKQIASTICQFNPDAIIVSQGAIGLSACGLGVKHETVAPIISFLPMAHRVASTRQGNALVSAAQDFCYRHLYALPDYFFTICASTADQLHSFHEVDPENVFVTYYGVEGTLVPEMSYAFKRKDDTPKKIGIIGRVEFFQKRHDFFFREFAGDNIHKSIQVYVIGDGPDLQSCRELVASSGLTDRVCFTGWVEDGENWYRKLDAALLPSRFEGLPLVVLEAMYYGVPVIASRVDGMKEMLPDEWLFTEGDGQQMMTVMKRVLYQDQTTFVQKNQEKVVNNFNRMHYRSAFSNNLHRICRMNSHK